METVAVVGLGYVGLPLAVGLAAHTPTIGFDLNEAKLESYRAGRDPSGEVSQDELEAVRQSLEFTSDPRRLAAASYIVVAVPTPIDVARRPELGPLRRACRLVGEHLSPGATVVFESTVYPGCTEEVCVPILEEASGKRWLGEGHAEQVRSEDGFYVGYSPERINPGDTEHRLDSIVKVVAGDCPETLDRLASLYGMVVKAGVYRASTIKVAEAAKVIENTQRDLNIALMNELAVIFHELEVDTLDVLEAAGSKWNFLPFRPGLVGGHCIGVDPYYLTYKAEVAGYHPQVILAGRHINDGMGKYIAEQVVKGLIRRDVHVNGARVLVLGLTFKEDCPDLRNSKVVDVIEELKNYSCEVVVHDPMVDSDDARAEYKLDLVDWGDLDRQADAVVLAVAHREYLQLETADFQAVAKNGALVVDVKSVLDREAFTDAGFTLWRL